MPTTYRVLIADTREFITTWAIDKKYGRIEVGHSLTLFKGEWEYVYEIMEVNEARREIVVWPKGRLVA